MGRARFIATSAWSVAGRVLIRLPLILFAGSVLLCIAPGFDSDERTADPRLSAQTVAGLRAARERQRNPLRMTGRYVADLVRGDLGNSSVLGAPVADIVRQRWRVTAVSVLGGAGAGWFSAAVVAMAVTALRLKIAGFGATGTATALICVPSALIGVGVMLFDGTVAMALAAVVFPRVYQYLEPTLKQAWAAPHVRVAQAAGMGPWRTFFRAAVPGALPELVVIAGLALNVGLAAIVPLEAICDSPGLAQLVWKSALGRDVPVLLFVTLSLATASMLASAAVDISVDLLNRRSG